MMVWVLMTMDQVTLPGNPVLLIFLSYDCDVMHIVAYRVPTRSFYSLLAIKMWNMSQFPATKLQKRAFKIIF